MCLIFVRQHQEAPLNKEALESAYTDNPDGVGFVWWNKGWRTCKSIDYTYEQVEAFAQKLDHMGLTWAVHFRWATTGGVTDKNCHPFPIGKGAYLMHNGVLPFDPTDPSRSDTWQFAQWVKQIGARNYDEYASLYEAATKGSRMLYALPGGRLELSGDWTERKEGLYSNTRCLYSKCYVPAKKYTASDYVYYKSTSRLYQPDEAPTKFGSLPDDALNDDYVYNGKYWESPSRRYGKDDDTVALDNEAAAIVEQAAKDAGEQLSFPYGE